MLRKLRIIWEENSSGNLKRHFNKWNAYRRGGGVVDSIIAANKVYHEDTSNSDLRGSYWYKYLIYKSGKIEVTGRVRCRGNVSTTINFPFNFPDTDYVVSMTKEADTTKEGGDLWIRSRGINYVNLSQTYDSSTYWIDFIILWLPENIDNL